VIYHVIDTDRDALGRVLIQRTMLEDTQGNCFLSLHVYLYLHTICILLDNRLVAFFDIDNTLYSANHKIAEAMYVRIHGK
jgi:DNA-directed RNA polymerase subunit L